MKLIKTPDHIIKWIGSVTSLTIHSILFASSFLLSIFKLVPFGEMLLGLTTVVSLEAIYLSIFIQMSVNKSNQFMEIIQEDVGEISENIEDIEENIDEMQKEEEDNEEIKESDLLNNIEETLSALQKEVAFLKKNRKKKKI